jgi:DNA replication protein DnaD
MGQYSSYKSHSKPEYLEQHRKVCKKYRDANKEELNKKRKAKNWGNHTSVDKKYLDEAKKLLSENDDR